MQQNNKHNIFSKEELLKLIDEKRSLPPDADDFDNEALEGLSMLTDRTKLDGLNESIDEVLRKEKKKAARRRNIYFLSAAASLLLIVGFFFLIKENTSFKKENELADNTLVKSENDISKVDESKTLEESAAVEKKLEDAAPATTATGEASGKEVKTDELKVSTKTGGDVSSGDAMMAVPAEAPVNAQPKAESKVALNEDAEERNSGGKDYKTTLAKDDQSKREESKKATIKIEDKEKEKTRYVTNTVWTSTPASGVAANDESKNLSVPAGAGKTADNRKENQVDQDGEGNANGIAAAQKNAEIAAYEKQSSNAPEKKSKAKKSNPAKPDTVVTEMLAGYSYYDTKPDKGLVQGGPPQKSQQTNAPVQVQNEVTTSSKLEQKVDIAQEQEADKKSGKLHDKVDNNKNVQNANARGNTDFESPQFVGGTEAMQQYVKKNLKISSPDKSGEVEAEFVVKTDGKIDTGSVKITSKIKNCKPCTKDVAEMVKTMPKWKPATENGKTISRKQKISVDYNSSKTDR